MSKKQNNKQFIAVLHNIRSLHNAGSMFRTAEAVGINKIYLTGYTPAPIDRFGRVVKEISKTALGAEKSIEWEQSRSISKLLLKLKKDGFYVIAIEQTKKSQDYKKIKVKNRTAFVLGNEVTGLPLGVLKTVDVVAEIPMRGKKESLNVSVAFGVALFRILGI